MHVLPVSPTAIPEGLEALYTDFAQRAQAEYSWPSPPLDFKTVMQEVAATRLHLLALLDDEAPPSPLAFWLYTFPGHKALELCVFHTDETCLNPESSQSHAKIREAFQLAFAHWLTLPKWEAFSFGLYGKQTALRPLITGLKVGNETQISLADQHILQRPVVMDAPPDNAPRVQRPAFPYAIYPMKPKWLAKLAPALCAAFCDEPDALWDPRFADEAGATLLLSQLSSGLFGHYHEALSWVAVDELRKPKPVGAIFCLQAEAKTLNIPLFFVAPEYRGKGLSTQLMAHLLEGCQQATRHYLPGDVAINATTNPVQLAAQRVYERFGFTLHEAGAHAFLSTKADEQ